MPKTLCTREGCENPVKLPRRKFCCEKCLQLWHRKLQVTRKRKDEKARAKRRTGKHRRVRPCLGVGCHREFMSEGPWQRKCPICRNKEAAE